MAEDERTRPGRLMDLAVYAPLGLALEIRKIFPDLAERGRRQIRFTRTIGQAAVSRSGTEIRRRVAARQGGTRDDGDGGAAEAPTGAAPTAQPAAGADGRDTVPSPTDLAIADYDSLSAQHVVRLLDGLGADELERVRRYEDRTRGRRTILTRIAQLQD